MEASECICIYLYKLLKRKQSKMKKQIFKQAGKYKVNKIKSTVRKCDGKRQ